MTMKKLQQFLSWVRNVSLRNNVSLEMKITSNYAH